MQTKESLREQVVAITGASGDIGRALVAAFASVGARVSGADIRLPRVPRRKARNVEWLKVDTTRSEEIDAWLDSISVRWGEPTLAVVNAAKVTVKSLRKVTPDEWRREIDVNLTGAFLFANAAAKRMAERGIEGAVVFIGSWAADRPHPHVPTYGVAKAGLRMLCRLIASEYASDGVRSFEVALGYVDAGLSAAVFRKRPRLREKARRRVPLRRLITPQEAADLVCDLCRPTHRHLTGCTVTCDGGLSL